MSSEKQESQLDEEFEKEDEISSLQKMANESKDVEELEKTEEDANKELEEKKAEDDSKKEEKSDKSNESKKSKKKSEKNNEAISRNGRKPIFRAQFGPFSDQTGPKNFFFKNKVPPHFKFYNITSLCKKSEKINEAISRKAQKPLFWAHFGPISDPIGPTKFFIKNRALSHLRVYHFAPLCKKSEKTNEPILRKAGNRRTDGRTNGRTGVNL